MIIIIKTGQRSLTLDISPRVQSPLGHDLLKREGGAWREGDKQHVEECRQDRNRIRPDETQKHDYR